MNAVSVFKSPESHDALRNAYREILSHFPFEQTYVDTTFGKTFVLTAGTDSNPPVILLHGSCSNSAFWFPEIMGLSQNYRVYAVDIIGEAGNSAEFRPELTSDAFALWMRDVLDSLGLKTAVFIGNSLGGWMALKFATSFPERVSKLILLASAGLTPIRPKFLRDVDKARGQDGTMQNSSLYPGVSQMPKEVLDFINLILASYNPIQELPVYSDDALLRLTMPVLFIDGESDEIIDARPSAERLSRLLPTAEVCLLPDCGHLIAGSITYIIPFLMQESSQ